MNILEILLIIVAAFVIGIMLGKFYTASVNRKASERFGDLNAPIVDSNEVLELLRAGRKIEAIKRYRQETGVGLKEAKDTVDRMAMEMSSAKYRANLNMLLEDSDEVQDPSGAASNYDSSTLNNEIRNLLRARRKIEAIKRYREKRGVGLKEAKDAVDRLEAEMGQG